MVHNCPCRGVLGCRTPLSSKHCNHPVAVNVCCAVYQCQCAHKHFSRVLSRHKQSKEPKRLVIRCTTCAEKGCVRLWQGKKSVTRGKCGVQIASAQIIKRKYYMHCWGCLLSCLCLLVPHPLPGVLFRRPWIGMWNVPRLSYCWGHTGLAHSQNRAEHSGCRQSPFPLFVVLIDPSERVSERKDHNCTFINGQKSRMICALYHHCQSAGKAGNRKIGKISKLRVKF